MTLLVLLLALQGCGSRQVILYPIDKADIVRMKQGQAYTADRDGWFISDFYLEEIAKARLK